MSFMTESIRQAQEKAYAAVEKLKAEPTAVVEYQSRGHVILIGDSQALASFGKLPDNPNHKLSSERIEYQGETPHEDISIKGALGKFVVNVAGQEIKGDLIVDLTNQPLLTMALKPPGYFIVDPNAASPDDAGNDPFRDIKNTLLDMIGTFQKPKYFNYDPAVCAHGRSGKPGCTRCIDACPAEAISSLIDTIMVEPSRCQGGGICATVCPSGAITYAYPKPKDLLTHVRTLLRSYLEAGEKPTDLVFTTESEYARAQQILPASLIITVEEVASVGPEVWLSALAWGARGVRLFDLGDATTDKTGSNDKHIPESARTALDESIDMVQRILSAMAFPATAVSFITDPGELITVSTLPEITLASHAPISAKRQAFYMALDHLVGQAAQLDSPVQLSTGAIFGDVSVNKQACTLCMSCVSACPGNALQDGNDKPMLGLVEANCLQCGICVNTCPEDAISLSPRLLLDPEARQKPRVLYEEEPFCCITCGKPFATQSGISFIMDKLSGHSMFADERSLNRLKMCDDCRVKDMMEDPNASL